MILPLNSDTAFIISGRFSQINQINRIEINEEMKQTLLHKVEFETGAIFTQTFYQTNAAI